MIETGFGKEFSEPPSVTVSAARTHCDACKEPLDPNVMHKCHGNQEYKPTASHTEITEKCPDCNGFGILGKIERITAAIQTYFVVVCKDCRTFVHPEVLTVADAIHGWNSAIAKQRETMSLATWPQLLADLPGDDERSNVIASNAQPSMPDLTNYQGACPAVHVDGEVCDWCENTGAIPPTKGDAE